MAFWIYEMSCMHIFRWFWGENVLNFLEALTACLCPGRWSRAEQPVSFIARNLTKHAWFLKDGSYCIHIWYPHIFKMPRSWKKKLHKVPHMSIPVYVICAAIFHGLLSRQIDVHEKRHICKNLSMSYYNVFTSCSIMCMYVCMCIHTYIHIMSVSPLFNQSSQAKQTILISWKNHNHRRLRYTFLDGYTYLAWMNREMPRRLSNVQVFESTRDYYGDGNRSRYIHTYIHTYVSVASP